MIETTGKSQETGLEVAVIGIACRFPGAGDVEEFWENLKNGVEAITFFSDKELEQWGGKPRAAGGSFFVQAKGVIEDNEFFEPAFFGLRPMDAELMDPQIRIFYEKCWEVLEVAGYDPGTYEGRIGLYGGANNNRLWEVMSLFTENGSAMGHFALDHLVDRDFLCTRIAHRLNLRGPAITLKTACSTSLVAVDSACRGLLTGQCDMAIAGGAAVISKRAPGYTYKEGMIDSPDGHCRTFDSRAHGVIFSDGVGVVLLKRLRNAIADRDTIYAVIKGSAVNNDGARKGTYEAPCVDGQAEVIRKAIHMAEVESETITYIEAHGTGTVIGDPIEIEGLTRAFNTEKKGYCSIGSVKSNVGHLDTAAGIAGFIKTVLAIKHRLIPPSLHFETPNPRIDFVNSPFVVNAGQQEWESNGYPLRAGVSSFGVGGTNVHVILEEAPVKEAAVAGRKRQMIMLSARTENALHGATQHLQDYLTRHPGVNLADVAYTLQVGRKGFPHRRMVLAGDVDEAERFLAAAQDPSAPDFDKVSTAAARESNRLVFMFSGQGAQYVNMGRDLYDSEPVFREEADRCFEMLKPLVDFDIKELLFPGDNVGEIHEAGEGSAGSRINQTEVTQPVIFIFEYALAKLLMHWGIKPYAMIGHSIGEYVAACLSGVFSLVEALIVVALRGKLMQQMPPGAMLSVSLPEEQLQPLLTDGIELAAVNASSLCVVSGPLAAVDAFETEMKDRGHQCRRLHTSHAYHSRMMEPILTQFEHVVKGINLHAPSLPFISNVTGTWIKEEEACSPGYWVNHLRSTVRFGDGISGLLEQEHMIFIELGPGRSLATFVNKNARKKPGQIVVNLIRHPREAYADDYYLFKNLGYLWLLGVGIDWSGFYSSEKRQRIPLPTYPFEKHHYAFADSALKTGGLLKPGQVARGKKPDISQWFYIPSWKRSVTPAPAKEAGEPAQQTALSWLFFMDEGGPEIGKQLVRLLGDTNPQDKIAVVQQGEAFTRVQAGSGAGESDGIFTYTVNPEQAEDYQALVAELKKADRLPRRIIHLWNITGTERQDREDRAAGQAGLEAEWVEENQYRGFYSLIYLAQALGLSGIEDSAENVYLAVVTDNMQAVTGEEALCPGKAALLGPVLVIPEEYANIRCTGIDVMLPAGDAGKEAQIIRQLFTEIRGELTDRVIAFRHHFRYVQAYEPARLTGNGTEAVGGRLREGGTYLITGGLGGIGLELAQYLASAKQAKLVLTSRSALPGREEWQQWLNLHDAHEKVSRQIRRVQELEKAGARVMVFAADVTDFQQMETVIAEAEKHLGKINGVIHAAGIPGGGMIQLKKARQAQQVLAAKINGTLVLERVLANRPLDFIVLCSSINSIVPMVGQVDYFAANAFLDAFAYYKTFRDGTPTISINWDTWQEVGMAVEAARRLIDPGKQAEQRNRDFPGQDTGHPLLGRLIEENPQQDVYVNRFTLDKQWVLDEHKITESKNGLAPGVTYLEMARKAFEKYAQNGGMEMREVYFFNPLIVGENEEREVRFILKKPETGNRGYDFLVESRTGAGEADWQKHAAGTLFPLSTASEPVTHDISGIIASCNQKEISPLGNKKEGIKKEDYMQRGLLIFGPRWQNIERIHLGENRGAAILHLHESFTGELESFKLHPALLDSATGFMFSYIGNSAYIPFSYKRLILKNPLKGKMLSYSRVVKDPGSESSLDTLKFDIIIMDENGLELADITEFTMLKVSDAVKGRIKEKEKTSTGPAMPAAGETDRDSGPLTDKQKSYLRDGILPAEGIEVFTRILGSSLPQVVVSTAELSTRLENARSFTRVLQKEKAADKKDPAALHPRPPLSTTYAAPKTETERLVAGVWQELLGIKQIGIHDNFFELGGDSLNIVQLNAKIKNVLKQDVPVAVMFSYLTIHSFVQYLKQKDLAGGAVNKEIDRTGEIEKSKNRMKAVKRRR